MQNKERLDKILVSKGYADNPSKAKALIMAGKIRRLGLFELKLL